jgi:hypothetical protein
MPNNTEVREGTEVDMKKDFVEIVSGDSRPLVTGGRSKG